MIAMNEYFVVKGLKLITDHALKIDDIIQETW